MDINRLTCLRDAAYAKFESALIPTVAPERLIGVRTPALRLLAREMQREGEAAAFLQVLPHYYFEENQLHAFLIGGQKDFVTTLALVEDFLPFIDNWATCDQLVPKALAKDKMQLLNAVRRWLASRHTYTLRFAIGVLMRHFLDKDFLPDYLRLVAGVKSEEYYVNMMVAWYFATSLAKQYESAVPYLQQPVLDVWTHNKTIQKATESYRVPAVRKEYLRTLKRSTVPLRPPLTDR